jgi:transketolase
VGDGNDLHALDEAIRAAQDDPRPSLIVVRTHIGYGSPNHQGASSAHGAALGDEEVALTKQNLEWPTREPFHVPEEALAHWRTCRDRGAAMQAEWQERFAAYAAGHADEANRLQARLAGELPEGWEDALPSYGSGGSMATRKASGAVLGALTSAVPALIGGSSDLAGSVMTALPSAGDFGADDYAGRTVHFGVREHAMGAVLNGMCLHGGVRPFGGTFLIFADYMRPAIRLAAMMGQAPIYLFSHDSIGLGEDGPTHQPIGTLASLRAIPNLTVIRPADANEVVEAWRVALRTADGPTAIVLTRQGVATLDRAKVGPAAGVARGGYVLSDSAGVPRAVLMASGSEVGLVLAAQQQLAEQGIPTRVVNMASLELFARQPGEYRNEVLPAALTKRLAVEAGHPMPWYRWVGSEGDVLGMERFGESAPGAELFAHFGFTADEIVARVKALVER